jgi:hypothetical protein
VSALLIDSGVECVADLRGLLPQDLRERIAPELLAEPPSAAALRVLATLRDQRWVAYVAGARIDWAALLEWARAYASPSARVRVELAGSLAGSSLASPSLLAGATALDAGNFEALLDALRIAREGLAA